MIRSSLVIGLLLIVLNLSAQLSRKNTDALIESQIRLVLKFQESAWNRGDIKSYMDGYWNSDSLLFVGSRGPTYGWSNTLSNYLKSYPNKEKMGRLSFRLLKIDILSDNQAFVVGKWNLERKTDALGGHFTLLWKRINEEWKIVTDHSSSE